jgi:hypothetical protein
MTGRSILVAEDSLRARVEALDDELHGVRVALARRTDALDAARQINRELTHIVEETYCIDGPRWRPAPIDEPRTGLEQVASKQVRLRVGLPRPPSRLHARFRATVTVVVGRVLRLVRW